MSPDPAPTNKQLEDAIRQLFLKAIEDLELYFPRGAEERKKAGIPERGRLSRYGLQAIEAAIELGLKTLGLAAPGSEPDEKAKRRLTDGEALKRYLASLPPAERLKIARRQTETIVVAEAAPKSASLPQKVIHLSQPPEATS